MRQEVEGWSSQHGPEGPEGTTTRWIREWVNAAV